MIVLPTPVSVPVIKKPFGILDLFSHSFQCFNQPFYILICMHCGDCNPYSRLFHRGWSDRRCENALFKKMLCDTQRVLYTSGFYRYDRSLTPHCVIPRSENALCCLIPVRP